MFRQKKKKKKKKKKRKKKRKERKKKIRSSLIWLTPPKSPATLLCKAGVFHYRN